MGNNPNNDKLRPLYDASNLLIEESNQTRDKGILRMCEISEIKCGFYGIKTSSPWNNISQIIDNSRHKQDIFYTAEIISKFKSYSGDWNSREAIIGTRQISRVLRRFVDSCSTDWQVSLNREEVKIFIQELTMEMDKDTRYSHYMAIVGPIAAQNPQLGIIFSNWLDKGREKSSVEIEEFIKKL